MHDEDPQYLYRIDGKFRFSRTQYIGVTNSVPRRMAEHQREKDWYPENGRITWRQYPDRMSVLDAEARAIHRKRPVHNIQHNIQVEVSAEVELDGSGLFMLLAMGFGVALLAKWGADAYSVRRTRGLAERQGIKHESPKVPCPFTKESLGTLAKLFYSSLFAAALPPPPPNVSDDPESIAAFRAWEKRMDPIAALWAPPSAN